MLFLLFFLIVVIIFAGFFNSAVNLFSLEREAKSLDPEIAFPQEFFYLYREADQEFRAPWALIAGTHYIQTDFASSGNLLNGYTDAFNLPNNIWYRYQISKREYWRIKNGANEDDEDYEPIPPIRSRIDDIIYTIGNYFESVNIANDRELNVKINVITDDRKKTEDIKFYYWLFDKMYGRPGWPVDDYYDTTFITSEFGNRKNPTGEGSDFHTGIDIAPPEGESIFAFADGKVISANENAGNYGTLIILEHKNYKRKDGKIETIRTYYAHSRRLFVENGQKVVGGQKIAEIGNEGRSTGPHLHFEVRIKPGIFSSWEPVEPRDYLITPEEVNKNI